MSVAGKASGQASARIAISCAVQSPIPGRARRASSVDSSGAPRYSGSRPAATSHASACRARTRWRTMPSRPSASGSACAMVAASGKRRSSPSNGVSMVRPYCCTMRCTSVRAAFTVTCWPRTTRSANSKPSKHPGSRSPGRGGTGSRASTGSICAGSASRSKASRTRCISAPSAGPSAGEATRCSSCRSGTNRHSIQPARAPLPVGRAIVRRSTSPTTCSMPAIARRA